MAELLRQKEEVIGHLDNERKGLKEQLFSVTAALREAHLSQSSVASERSEVASDGRPVSRTPSWAAALDGAAAVRRARAATAGGCRASMTAAAAAAERGPDRS